VEGEIQLGPLGTAATSRPIVPTPGDYDDGEIDGMIIGRGNRNTRRKPAPVPLVHHKPHILCPDANPGRRGGKPATNRLSCGTALQWGVTWFVYFSSVYIVEVHKLRYEEGKMENKGNDTM
jgi:hypothetical protein